MNQPKDLSEYFRNKRDQYIVEIRKKKNDQFIQTKRYKYVTAVGAQMNDQNIENSKESRDNVLNYHFLSNFLVKSRASPALQSL